MTVDISILISHRNYRVLLLPAFISVINNNINKLYTKCIYLGIFRSCVYILVGHFSVALEAVVYI